VQSAEGKLAANWLGRGNSSRKEEEGRDVGRHSLTTLLSRFLLTTAGSIPAKTKNHREGAPEK